MKAKSDYQDFLKIIAIITMIIDHIGLYIFPEYEIMRVIGRLSMPLFCFFAGYNFHNKPKFKILIAGVLLHIFTITLFKQFIVTNILITIFLGQCYLYYFGNNLKKFFYKGYFHVVLLGSLWFCTWFFVDYGTIAIAIMVLGYIAKHDQIHLKLAVATSLILMLLHATLIFQFSYINIIILLILAIFEYLIIVTKSFEQKIAINLRIISHYTLYIYVMHLAVLQFCYSTF